MRANAIYSRIKGIEYPIGVEIGVFRGEMSKRLLELHSGLRLIMIDAWDKNTYDGAADDAVSERFKNIYQDKCVENFKTCVENVSEFNRRTLILRGKSLDYAKRFESIKGFKFDFVFVDASHDYESVKNDIQAWMKFVKSGGWICGHDYGVENFPGVKRAVDELFSNGVETDEDFTFFVRV